MSRYLQATEIAVTTNVATGKNHEGKPCIFKEIPVGTVIATDAEGDMYVNKHALYDLKNCSPEIYAERIYDKPSGWPLKNKKTGTIQLFREYWKLVDAAPKSPLHTAYLKVPKKVLR